ncbi:MAG: SPASM domain-containing protein, partial [Thermoplasmataceae archaeon]
MNLTPTRLNIDNISQYVELLIGVKEFGATPMVLLKKEDRKYIPDPKTAYDVEKRVKQILTVKGITYLGGISGAFCQQVSLSKKKCLVNKEGLLSNAENADIQCNAGISKFHVSSEGKIFPCVFWQSEGFLMGNLLKDKLFNIWNKWELKRTLRQLNHTGCWQCVYYNLCKGGCPGMVNSFFGKI